MSDLSNFYDATDWYWLVAETDRVWSSGVGAYVDAPDTEEKLSRIASEVELAEVLGPYGLPGPVPRPVAGWRIKAALAMRGLADKVDPALASMETAAANEVRARLDYGLPCERGDAAMKSFGAGLAMTGDALDELWRAAEAL